MCGTRRSPDEAWVDFIKRAMAKAESCMMDLNYLCWTAAYRRCEWRFAAKAAQTTDGRWSKRLLDWQPHFRCTPHRSVGHPKTRWEDGFTKIAGGDWPSLAASDMWPLLEYAFVSQAV